MNPKKKLGFLKGREKDKDHKGKNKPAKKEYGSDYADYCNACTCCGGGDDTYGVHPVEKHFGGGFHSSRRSSQKSEYESSYYDSGWVSGGGYGVSGQDKLVSGGGYGVSGQDKWESGGGYGVSGQDKV